MTWIIRGGSAFTKVRVLGFVLVGVMSLMPEANATTPPSGIEKLDALRPSLEDWEATLVGLRLQSSVPVKVGFFKGATLNTYTNAKFGGKETAVVRGNEILLMRYYIPWKEAFAIAAPKGIKPDDLYGISFAGRVLNGLGRKLEELDGKQKQDLFAAARSAYSLWQSQPRYRNMQLLEIDGVVVLSDKNGTNEKLEILPISTLRKRNIAAVHGIPAQ